MKRFGQIARLKPEKIEEYDTLHAAVWPGVLSTITACKSWANWPGRANSVVCVSRMYGSCMRLQSFFRVKQPPPPYHSALLPECSFRNYAFAM